MKYSTAFFGAIVASLALVGNAVAAGGSYQDQVDKCVSQYANDHDSAAITLECTADAGKLSACKVVESTTSLKGFEKAAMCVAEFLPVGSKTGQIKVPVRFPGNKG
jgi:phage-related minor tail protein